MSINDFLSKTIPQKRDHPFLIGVAGGSGSGKTSVSSTIFNYLGKSNCLLFSMDTYYKDLTEEDQKQIQEYNFDEPDALDLDLLSFHLNELMNWREIDMPTYDFKESKRGIETERLKPNHFIIFEGILAFHDKRIRDLMDLKIFVDLDADIRLSRRIYRDIIERGREMNNVIGRYHKFVKPAYETYIHPTRKYADIIIPRGGENTNAIDLIAQYLKVQMKKMFPYNNNKNEGGENVN
jgi:uridine kinase